MLQVWAVDGIPEIVAGDDLATIIGDAIGDYAKFWGASFDSLDVFLTNLQGEKK